jgi:hypothetical protein
MEYQDPAEKRYAEWNGNPADYPWFEPSAELAAALESQDPEGVIPENGMTRRELLEYFLYLEEHDYWKGLPQKVCEYREKLWQERENSQANKADASAAISDDELPS